MNLKEDVFDIMCQVNPEYEQHMRYENGKQVWYLLFTREIYGCIDSELLWYNPFYTMLEGFGFEINPYDKCVANKVIEVTKCTIAWYIEDNKLSHKNLKLIQDIINEVKRHFGQLSAVRGNKHTLLGMNIYTKEKTIQVNMFEQLKEYIESFSQDVSALVTSTATKNIFEVRKDSEQLSEKKGENFHSVVANLLFIINGSIPYLDMAVSFLTTMVSKSDS